jgi:hypothetical protein
MKSEERRAYFEQLGEAIERAAEQLPEGYTIDISIEKNGGGVELYDDEGDEIGFPSNYESLAATITDAIEFAIENVEAVEKERGSQDEST